MKVRVSNGRVRYRLDPSEVHDLGAGKLVTVGVGGWLSYTLRVREIPGGEPLWVMSNGHFDLSIPRSAIQSPSTDQPVIYQSDTYLVELDLKPDRP
jgi:hypothetical protein